MKNVFITGISGLLGNNLAKILNDDNDVHIVGFILNNDPAIPFLKVLKNVDLVTGDITDKDDVRKFLTFPVKGDKYLVHTCARISAMKNGDELTMKVNYDGTRNIVDIYNELDFKKFIYISSIDATKQSTGNTEITEAVEISANKVLGTYSKSKVLATHYVIDHVKNYIIILPSSLLGPNCYTSTSLNKVIKDFADNKIHFRMKGGDNLVDVRDVSQGIINAMFSDKTNTTYILSGQNITIKDLFDKLSALTNRKKVKISIPYFVVNIVSPFVVANAKRKKKLPMFTSFSVSCLKHNYNFSYKKAANELNYHPRSLDITLKDTLDYFKTNNR